MTVFAVVFTEQYGFFSVGTSYPAGCPSKLPSVSNSDGLLAGYAILQGPATSMVR